MVTFEEFISSKACIEIILKECFALWEHFQKLLWAFG